MSVLNIIQPVKNWKRTSGTNYQAFIKVAGPPERKLYIEADANTGNFVAKIAAGPFGVPGTDAGIYSADTGRFTITNSVNLPKLTENDLEVLQKTIPSRIYDINAILANNSTAEDIENGIGISKEDQLEFRNKLPYQKIETAVSTEPILDADVGSTLNELNETIKPANANPLDIPPEGLTYPISKKYNDTQDYIQFAIGEYNPKSLKLGENTSLGKLDGTGRNTLTGIIGYINLPVQPSIVDSNTVDWNENRLNPLQVAGLQVGTTLLGDKKGNFIEKITNALEGTARSPDLVKAGKLLIAQESVGAQNVLSRFGGAVVNPNLELLFNGPQLRPFNFNFKLSPREAKEATEVRRIIRAFKQAMAPKVTGTGLFLAAPNIFQIKYVQAGNFDHPSLNRIKLCALKSCVVDYTPENSYMTFKDSSNTMVSYTMSLQFQELEPVTDADYNGLLPDEIGY